MKHLLPACAVVALSACAAAPGTTDPAGTLKDKPIVFFELEQPKWS